MNLRLLPLLGISASALLALKLLGLVMGTGAVNVGVQEAGAQETPADAPAAEGGETPAEMPSDIATDEPPPLPDSLEIGGSLAERAVLESLGKRRQDLNKQQGELDLREKLLKATEERIEKRVEELKDLEKRIEGAVQRKEEREEAEIKGLVTMYESMKPKDAARIFDRLELSVLMKVVRNMKPRKMADILGKMSSESAERLTVAIARGADRPMPRQASAPEELPKIPSN